MFKLRHRSVRIVRPGKSFGTMYSQDGQDLALLPRLLKSALVNPLIIVDVGANHPIKFSNSYFFERFLAARVLAVDPLEEFSEAWRELRPTAKYVVAAASDRDGETTVMIPQGGDTMFSKVGVASRKLLPNTQWIGRTVPAVTLNSLLDEEKIGRVTLLTLDVEGHELRALKGIDLDRFKGEFVLLENNDDRYFGDERVREYLIDRGYRFEMRIGSLDDLYVRAQN